MVWLAASFTSTGIETPFSFTSVTSTVKVWSATEPSVEVARTVT